MLRDVEALPYYDEIVLAGCPRGSAESRRRDGNVTAEYACYFAVRALCYLTSANSDFYRQNATKSWHSASSMADRKRALGSAVHHSVIELCHNCSSTSECILGFEKHYEEFDNRGASTHRSALARGIEIFTVAWNSVRSLGRFWRRSESLTCTTLTGVRYH